MVQKSRRKVGENEVNGTEGIRRDTENDTDDTEESTSREAKVISLIKKNNSVSRKTVAQMLGISTATVARDIDSLKSKGIIERVGGDRGGYWKIK
jgi:ATP-dependent DNA helicase RecG